MNEVNPLFLRKVNQSILTSAETLIYRCENSAHSKKTAALLQRVSLSARGRLAGATFAGNVLLSHGRNETEA